MGREPRASAGIEPPPSFLDVNRLWSFFGDAAERAVSRYRATVQGVVGV